ncbi:porin [Serratia grimesii]|uniref:porin n=1 Tax=Serratia grimesii TaxID=82995 RepID=UPI00077C64C1|nr:porin [Serratia grimesii]CAI0929260.1 Outer membrane pore protein E precursor [Serratia grimesii]CAI2407833.1 Outer membrane pore protein E precursor [Serratia grimesii]SUI35634.1 Outer membrane pore protein E precursor [Serratia grimesii]
MLIRIYPHRLVECLCALSIFFCSSTFAISLKDNGQDRLDFYGTIIARRYSSSNVRNDGDRSYIYFGLLGKRKLSQYWRAYAHWEYTVSFADASRNSTRLAYIGMQNPALGSIDIGRNWGVLYDVTSLTDRSPLFREMSYNYIDNFMRGRALNLLTYRKKIKLLQSNAAIALQYQFKSNSDEKTVSKQNGNGIGASFIYALTPTITTIFSASSSLSTQQQGNNAGYGKKINTLAEGVRYANKRTYLAAVFTQSNSAIKPQKTDNCGSSSSYEILAKYLLTDKLQPNIGYTRLMQTYSGKSESLLNYEEVGFSWLFNKNMQAFFNYEFNNMSKNNPNVDASDKLEVGISYHW